MQLETSLAFAQAQPLPVPVLAGAEGERGVMVRPPVLCESLGAIALPSTSLDRILSLAGLHHLEDRSAFYREAYRLLRPGGLLCLADVWDGSGVGAFLNDFVDRHSSLGHCGDFLSLRDAQGLLQAGFELRVTRRIAYPWQFCSVWEMVEFCRQLFGIDRAHPEQSLAGIQTHLGYREGDRPETNWPNRLGCEMAWELYFIQAVKPTGL